MSYKERLQEIVKTKQNNSYYKQNNEMFDNFQTHQDHTIYGVIKCVYVCIM